MRSNPKRQFDYTKVLIKENSLEAFQRLDGSDSAEVSIPQGGKVGRTRTPIPEVPKKDETISADQQNKSKPNIAIPSVVKLEDAAKAAELSQKEFQVEENYIRYSYVKIYPRPEIYEATDYDLEFLKELNSNSSGKLKPGSEQITIEEFERIIEIWDAETDKGEPISLEAAQVAVQKLFKNFNRKDQISEIYIVSALCFHRLV